MPGLGLATVFVAVLILAIAVPRPEVVEGTDRPAWLPEEATDVFYRSQEGFGWWKAAEFTMSEREFRGWAARQGWALSEERNYAPPGTLQLIKPKGRQITEEDLVFIPRALVYERRARNNGGIAVALDPSISRAWYTESHR